MVVGYAPSSPDVVGVSMQAYHLPDGRRLWSVEAHRAETFLTFSPDGRQIVSYSPGSYASEYHAFDTSTGAEISLAGAGRHDQLLRIALGPSGQPAIMAAGSGIFALNGDFFTVPDSTFPLPGGEGIPIASIAISGDGQWLATGSLARDQSAIVWNLQSHKVQRTLTGPASSTVTFSGDSREVVRVWDSIDGWSIATGDQVWESLSPANVPTVGGMRWFVAVSPTGDRVATNFGTGVTIFSPTDPNTTTQLNTGQPFAAMSFSPDGQTLATSGPIVWRLSDGQKLWPAGTLAPPPATPADKANDLKDNWVAFSPDGALLMVSDFLSVGGTSFTDFRSYRTVTKIYRASDGALVRDMGNSLARRPAFSPDGAWIVAGSWVYPTLSGAPVQLSPDTEFDSVSAFGPDGTIAVGGTDGVTRLYCPR
jgi:WD40 repeat protein